MFKDIVKDNHVRNNAMFIVLFFILAFFNIFVSNILMGILMGILMFGSMGWAIVAFNKACDNAESNNV